MSRSRPVFLFAILTAAVLASFVSAKGRQPEPAPYEPIRFEELPPLLQDAPEKPQASAPAAPEPEPADAPPPSFSASEMNDDGFKSAATPEPVPEASVAAEPAEAVTPSVESEEPAVQETPKRQPELVKPPVASTYKVWIWQENGDTLARIAKKVYGDASKWEIIYLANRDVIKNPHKIYPKQKLKIPPADWQP